MIDAISAEDRETRDCAALVRAMVAASSYRRMLSDIEPEIVRVALLNDQIRAALGRLVKEGRVPASPWLRFRRPNADERILISFIEYLAFASPAFLASVGEWPLGARRG